MPKNASAFDKALASETARETVEKIRRLELDRRMLAAEVSGLRRDLHKAERLREGLFRLTRPRLSVPSWAVSAARRDSADHVPVLFSGDFHWGESISGSRIGGINEYGVAIAEKRYRRMIERTVDISLAHLPKNRYPGIVLLRLGDMISGEIHPDFSETNELHAIPAVRSLVASESWGIKTLAERFGRVHVVSVPGNHGRTTRKPQSKRGSDSFDTLSAWWLESRFADDDHVTFQTPESGDALITIMGRRYLVTHGDKIGSRGGEGLVGPEATIVRGMKRVHDQYAKLGQPLAGVFVGHFHVAREFGLGWSNGSVCGYSEYARDGRMTPEPPEQWLIFFHPKYGATSRWKVRLEASPVASQTLVHTPFEAS